MGTALDLTAAAGERGITLNGRTSREHAVEQEQGEVQAAP